MDAQQVLLTDGAARTGAPCLNFGSTMLPTDIAITQKDHGFPSL